MANNITKNTAASEHVVLYINNTREIYTRIESLRRQVKNRMKKNLPVTREHLAESSALRKIVRDAAKIARQDTWCQPTPYDIRAARYRIADEIYDEAELELKQYI